MDYDMNEQFQPATMGRPQAGAEQPGATQTIETYVCPRSLDQAAEMLRAGNVTILAGGTDLMPQSKTGRARFHPVLMNIRRIPELSGISESNGIVRFGALTTVT